MMNREYWETDEDVDLDCIPNELCLRIRQERIRCELTEKELADALGIGWRRMRAIENGRGKQPDTTLIAAMGAKGLDIKYIMIAEKSANLKPDEAALLDNYRNTTPERKASLREVGSAFAKPKLIDDENCA